MEGQHGSYWAIDKYRCRHNHSRTRTPGGCRALVGKKAKFTHAIWIVVLGIVIGAIIGALIGGLIAAIIMFIIWLMLIKHFFDCGWLMAFAIAVVAVIIFVIIVAILAFIGIAVIGLGL